MTTLSTPSLTLSALPVRPYSRPVGPVPCTDSPAPITCPYSPIQSHHLQIACHSRSAISGGLRSRRLAADQLPIPPITEKTNPPAPPEKNLCPELRDPHAGAFAFAPEGEAISSRDPKNGNTGAGVCRFWSAEDTHDCYPRCDRMRSEQQERCRGRSNVVGSSALKRSIWNLQIFGWCKMVCTCEYESDLFFLECNRLDLNGLAKELQSMEI